MERIRTMLNALTVGTPVTHGTLTMVPLLGPDRAPDYLTLDDALAQKLLLVTEVRGGASVPELEVLNNADRPVFIVDGEELIGARQNRVMNLSLLVPAQTTLKVPVSCVEQGRWSPRSAEVAAAPHAQPPRARSMKIADVTRSMDRDGSRCSDQGQMWADIAACSAYLKVPSPTHAMADLFRQCHDDLEPYVRVFAAVPRQVGALFVMGQGGIGLDLFDAPSTLAHLLPKIVRSYALHTIEAPPSSATTDDAAARTMRLLKRVTEAQVRFAPAVGLGEDARLEAEGLVGAGLVANGHVVHLCAFTKEGWTGGEKGGQGSAGPEFYPSGRLRRAFGRRPE